MEFIHQLGTGGAPTLWGISSNIDFYGPPPKKSRPHVVSACFGMFQPLAKTLADAARTPALNDSGLVGEEGLEQVRWEKPASCDTTWLQIITSPYAIPSGKLT